MDITNRYSSLSYSLKRVTSFVGLATDFANFENL